MPTVILTGATGYLGHFLAERILSSRPDIEILSLARRRHDIFESLPRFRSVLFDQLPGPAQIAEIERLAPLAYLHAAALASAPECETSPEMARVANVELSRIVSEMAARSGSPSCYISTDLVFDAAPPRPGGFVETDAPHPGSVYSRTKAEAERLFLGKPRTSVFRLSLLYGPAAGDRKGPLGWMIDSFSKREPLTLFRDEWRTPIYVGDAACAIWSAIEAGLIGLHHCGGPERVNRVQFAEQLARVYRFDESLIQSKLRRDVQSIPARPEDVSLDSSLLRSRVRCGFRGLVDGLEAAKTYRFAGWPA